MQHHFHNHHINKIERLQSISFQEEICSKKDH